MGFFDPVELLSSAPLSDAPLCGACGFFRKCNSPKMPVTGLGEKGIMVVGPWPTVDEDERGVAFTDDQLRRLFRSCGVSLTRDCWLTHALICRPQGKVEDKHMEWCRPSLVSAIAERNPRVIITLGKWATRSLVGHLWKDSPGSLLRWVGWKIPDQSTNAWVCPTFSEQELAKLEQGNNKAGRTWWRRHLTEALALGGRPWKEVPDFASQVECVFDHRRAAKLIRELTATGESISFDYEADSLKPDKQDSKILSAAITCAGKTVSYLWHGEAVAATSEMLKSSSPKILANATFERRWTAVKLGHGIRNVVWDTIDSAHWMDNREQGTSVKFQSYVLLGQPSYNDEVKPYMEDSGGYSKNRLAEFPKERLLLYNGLDAVLEHEIAFRQMEITGLKVV